VQEYMKTALTDQEEGTRLGLEFVQTTANLSALKAMIEEKAEKLRAAEAEYSAGAVARAAPSAPR
jgi:hypothetical protein